MSSTSASAGRPCRVVNIKQCVCDIDSHVISSLRAAHILSETAHSTRFVAIRINISPHYNKFITHSALWKISCNAWVCGNVRSEGASGRRIAVSRVGAGTRAGASSARRAAGRVACSAPPSYRRRTDSAARTALPRRRAANPSPGAPHTAGAPENARSASAPASGGAAGGACSPRPRRHTRRPCRRLPQRTASHLRGEGPHLLLEPSKDLAVLGALELHRLERLQGTRPVVSPQLEQQLARRRRVD